MNKIFCLIGILALFVPPLSIPVYGQRLSKQEQAILDYIDGHTSDSVGLLETLINIESPTENLQGVKAMGSVLRKEFDALGMSTKWIDMPPEMNRAGHDSARINILVRVKFGLRSSRII